MVLIDAPSIPDTGTGAARVRRHILSNLGTNTVNVLLNEQSCEILVVAGGGAGGTFNGNNGPGGGGGGGEVYYNTSYSIASVGIVSYTVGDGGGTARAIGTNSSFGSVITYGGGGGGQGSGAPVIEPTNGGSGGGGGRQNATGGLSVKANASGFGNNGATSVFQAANGGGGAGGTGFPAPASTSGGNGGIGTSIDITGTSLIYGAGGAGGSRTNAAIGYGGNNVAGNGAGNGGGCTGSTVGELIQPSTCTPNRGGGGGGAGAATINSAIASLVTTFGAGGSGVVVVKYLPRLPVSPTNNHLSISHINLVLNNRVANQQNDLSATVYSAFTSGPTSGPISFAALYGKIPIS